MLLKFNDSHEEFQVDMLQDWDILKIEYSKIEMFPFFFHSSQQVPKVFAPSWNELQSWTIN